MRSSRLKLYAISKNADSILAEYKQIIANCRKDKKKYDDSSFYPNIPINPKDTRLLKDCEWKRLEEVYGNNVYDNIDEYGLCQGELSDCYLISVLIHMTKKESNVRDMFQEPLDISTGCVCVKFQIFEKPAYVIIDTKVPFRDGTPVFARPRTESDSYWFALIEKAYIKFMGTCRDIKGGAAINACYHILGYNPTTIKLAELKTSPSEHIQSLLDLNCDVYASIDKNEEAVKLGLIDDHTYAVFGLNSPGGKQIIHLRNPHGKMDEWCGDFSAMSDKWEIGYKRQVGYKEGGHFWITDGDFNTHFASISAGKPLLKGWFQQTCELDIEPGVLDGRTPFGNGPFVGSLKQFLVTFSEPCKVEVLFEEVCESHHSHVLFMQQNEGAKLSAAGDDYFTIKSSDETISEVWDVKDVTSPYTLVMSREHAKDKPAHYYVRMRAPVRFTIEPIDDPDYSKMKTDKITAKLVPGETDGRYPGKGKNVSASTQWVLPLKKPTKLYMRAKKPQTGQKVTVFLGHAMKDGKVSRKLRDYFIVNKKMHQKSELEEWVWKVTDLRRPLVLGVCRDMMNQACDVDVEVFCEDQEIKLTKFPEYDDLQEKFSETIEGTLKKGWTENRSPYGTIEGLSPLQQFKLTVNDNKRMYFIFTHDGSSKHRIALQKTYHPIDHFGRGEDEYFETSMKYERFYFDPTPGTWHLCVHRERAKDKKESHWKLEIHCETEFKIEKVPLPDYDNLYLERVTITLGPGRAIGGADGVMPFKQDLTPLPQWRVLSPVAQKIHCICKRKKGPDISTAVFMQSNGGQKSKCSYQDVPECYYKLKANSRGEAFDFDVPKMDLPWSLTLTRAQKHSSFTKIQFEMYTEYPIKVTRIDDGIDEDAEDTSDSDSSSNDTKSKIFDHNKHMSEGDDDRKREDFVEGYRESKDYPVKDYWEDRSFIKQQRNEVNKQKPPREEGEEDDPEYTMVEYLDEQYKDRQEQEKKWGTAFVQTKEKKPLSLMATIKDECEVSESNVPTAPQYIINISAPGTLVIDTSVDRYDSNITAFVTPTLKKNRVGFARWTKTITENDKQFKVEIVDDTTPFALGFFAAPGKHAKVKFSVSLDNYVEKDDEKQPAFIKQYKDPIKVKKEPISPEARIYGELKLEKADAFDAIPHKELKGELTKDDENRNCFGSDNGLTPLQQIQLKFSKPAEVIMKLDHEGSSKFFIALQKKVGRIAHFVTNLEDKYFETTEKSDAFAYRFSRGSWTLCVFSPENSSNTSYDLKVCSYEKFEFKELERMKEDELKKSEIEAKIDTFMPIFRSKLTELQQWHITSPSKQQAKIVLKRKSGPPCTVIFFIQDFEGRKIIASLRGIPEKKFTLVENAKDEVFDFEFTHAGPVTCLFTRLPKKRAQEGEADEESQVEAEIYTKDGVLISAFEGDEYTNDMKARDKKFIDEFKKQAK